MGDFGLALRGEGSSFSYSGSTIPTTTMDINLPDPFDYDYEAYLLAKALKPGETMVLCCPRYINLWITDEDIGKGDG